MQYIHIPLHYICKYSGHLLPSFPICGPSVPQFGEDKWILMELWEWPLTNLTLSGPCEHFFLLFAVEGQMIETWQHLHLLCNGSINRLHIRGIFCKVSVQCLKVGPLTQHWPLSPDNHKSFQLNSGDYHKRYWLRLCSTVLRHPSLD